MAPVKRKIQQQQQEDPAGPQATRRTTRQNAAEPPHPVQPDPGPRRRRPRAAAADKAVSTPAHTQVQAEGHDSKTITNGVSVPVPKRLRTMKQTVASADPPMKTTRSTRQGGDDLGAVPNGIENIKPGGLANFSAAAAPTTQRPTSRRNGPPRQPLQSHPQTVGIAKPITMAMSSPPVQQQDNHQPPNSATLHRQSGRPDRNIDKVVLGNICFKSWYPSYYGKEVTGDATSHSGKAQQVNGGTKDEEGAKQGARRERDQQFMLDRLYVCPCCFKYSKELVAWWKHVRICEKRGFVPGEKIYVHPKPKRVPQETPVPIPRPFSKKKKPEPPPVAPQGIKQDDGEWSIWEVDGEKDVLFCQNLSLFAKLFLDNKSVFFDVTGFHYFLLVFTPSRPASAIADDSQPKHHIVGFFSKEKMSWDNNNLACILVFPPWQRKGLGALLMGVSYEISKREGVLGGPEKPISDLGKKGYNRYWQSEVARWILTLDLSGTEGEETIVDIQECSKATWIAPEDCLSALREMGVVEDFGMGPPKLQPTVLEEPSDEEHQEEEPKPVKDVPRVKISKTAVQQWVTANKLNLARACDPAGFVEGYAIKQAHAVEEEEAQERT